MKTFNTFLTESQAHDQAQSMKLEYYGFGRYGRNNMVTHINHAGRLVPVQKSFPSKKGEDVLLHYEHIEDQLFNKGVAGAKSALDILHSLVKNPKMVETQTKIDGSPSLFYGKQDGKFFVATKSMANKEPKINFTNEDIERNHGHAPGLVEKLKAALEHLPKIYKGGDNEIHQGDVMFTKNDVDTRDIQGKTHYTFKPNTVRNAIPVDSTEGKKIKKSKFGFAIHSKYNDDNERLPASHKDSYKHPDVYTMKVTAPDAANSPDAHRKLSALGGTLAGTHKDTFDFVSQAHLAPLFKQYINSKVRDKSENAIDGSDFINFVKQIKQKEIDKVKTPAKKAEKQQVADDILSDLNHNKEHINRAFIIHKSISDSRNNSNGSRRICCNWFKRHS